MYSRVNVCRTGGTGDDGGQPTLSLRILFVPLPGPTPSARDEARPRGARLAAAESGRESVDF
eukprot:2465010-Prymnesium_polylepis.1